MFYILFFLLSFGVNAFAQEISKIDDTTVEETQPSIKFTLDEIDKKIEIHGNDIAVYQNKLDGVSSERENLLNKRAKMVSLGCKTSAEINAEAIVNP